MGRASLLGLAFAVMVSAADPVHSAWILGPPGNGRLPDVRSVEGEGEFVVVRSSGITLHYLGPLQDAPAPNDAPVEFRYRIPAHPQRQTGRHARVGTGVIGAFLNGMPIYNQFAALSYAGANLWHYDAVALRDDGRLTAAGYPRAELTEPATRGLLEQLIAASGGTSPLIGFALDGYPVYGPWVDGRRMRSSYRLRAITKRESWPDGTELTPEQYGPDVGVAPLGTFAEDYEYVAGSGDLDEFNGRFVNGTYGYFLSTDERGRLTYPYLIGSRYYGKLGTAPGAFGAATGQEAYRTRTRTRLRLQRDPVVTAGRAARLRFTATDGSGEPIRDFEYVHERAIHLFVASEDLRDFAHIHPELIDGDAYEVAYTFPRSGRYRMWADYSLAGEPPHVDSFDVTVSGDARESSARAGRPAPLGVRLSAEGGLRAGEDIPIWFHLTGDVDKLQPYLGAWAHLVVVSKDLESYAHAHPVERLPALTGPHTYVISGPAPSEVRIVTSFPKAGDYQLWAQFQFAGEVYTFPFPLHIAAAAPRASAEVIPRDALVVHVNQHGYDPPRLEIPANRAVRLAFVRDGSPNCGSEVVFPSLGIRKALAPNSTAIVELPAQPAGEISFACGMGMFRGMIISRYRTSQRSD